MMKRRHWESLYRAILLVLIFLLASEPVLVAAKPQVVDPRQEAIDTFTVSGDIYLTNVADTLLLSAGLVNSVSAIQNTPLTQISENAIAQTRSDALKAAESSAIVLGSVDDLASSIESFGSNLPAAFDALQRAGTGLPADLRNDLIQEAGLSSTDVDAISGGMDDILLERQSMAANGMPVEVAAQLSFAGFSQAEIDQLATVAGTRGLANPSLTTSLAQFRASQDEWADVRTHMLILNIQLMGYQIGVRQANGIEPRAVTDTELQEIAQDELHLLVHVAHLQELWGSDPNLNVGEGDWWFIEHYAGRAAERLDGLIIESQNRGLIADLFVLQEMRLLALSAKSGDAEYVKQELDGLGEVLSYLVGDQTFISRQRDELRGLSYIAARWISHPNLRERVQWPVDQEVKSGAAKLARVRLDTMGVENLTPLFGVIAEQNEDNNIKTLLFMAGLSYFDQATAAILQEIIAISASIGQMELVDLIQAILTGDTDNPLLIATNIFLGMIPVVNVITDIFALVAADGTFLKAMMLFALFCDIGESLALIPGLQITAGAFIGGAVVAVVKVLFRNGDVALKAIVNGYKLGDAFKVIVDLVKVVSNYITTTIQSLDDAIQVLQGIMTSGLKLWDHFVAFVKRVGADMLLKLGFDEGSLLIGRILNLGVDLSDEALIGLKRTADDLIAAGVDLSDEAAEGLGRATKIMSGDELKQFAYRFLNTCVAYKSAAKVAMPALGCSPEVLENVLTSLQRFDDVTFANAVKLKQKVGLDNFGTWMETFAKDPDQLADAQELFNKFGRLNNISPDALKRAIDQGPDAVKAFSHWPDNLLNGVFEKELADRAGKDAEAIRIVSTWTTTSTPDVADVAGYSTNGNGRLFALGPAGDYDDPLGWVQFARQNEADFYFTNPEVSRIIENLYPNLEDRRRVFLSINMAALDGPGGPIEKGMDVLYEINSKNPDDLKALPVIWRGGSDAEILNELNQTGNLPFRIEELKLLYAKGFGYYKNPAGNIVLTRKPMPTP